MDQIIQTFVTVLGVAMSFGYFPQAYRIWKNKSAADISIPSFAIFGLGTFAWTLYGFYIGNIPLILSFIFGVIGSWLILGLSLHYKKNDRGHEH